MSHDTDQSQGLSKVEAKKFASTINQQANDIFFEQLLKKKPTGKYSYKPKIVAGKWTFWWESHCPEHVGYDEACSFCVGSGRWVKRQTCVR